MQDVDYRLCQGRQIFTLNLTMLVFITERETHATCEWQHSMDFGLDRIKKKASGEPVFIDFCFVIGVPCAQLPCVPAAIPKSHSLCLPRHDGPCSELGDKRNFSSFHLLLARRWSQQLDCVKSGH